MGANPLVRGVSCQDFCSLMAFHAKAPARPPCQSRSSCPQTPRRIVSEPAQWSPSSTRPPAESASGAYSYQLVSCLNAPACGIGTRGLLGMAILAQKACGVWALPKSVPYRGFLPTLSSRPNRILCWRASFAYPRGTSRRGALAAFRAEGPSRSTPQRHALRNASGSALCAMPVQLPRSPPAAG